MVRIRCGLVKARYNLGTKFGCDPEAEAVTLINLARDLGLNVVGISFHVGSSCEDFEGYAKAIEVSRQLYEVATSMGFQIRLLDLGGGYPGDSFQRINEFSAVINRALDENFPIQDFPKLEIISEPGRYMVESAFTLAAMVHSRKVIKNANGDIEEVMLYLNEGVYSNFLAIPLGQEFFQPIIMPEKVSETKFKTTIWGNFIKLLKIPACIFTSFVFQLNA